MASEYKKLLAKRGLESLAFFSRSQAVGRFKKNKAEMLRRQAMAQNGGVDANEQPNDASAATPHASAITTHADARLSRPTTAD
jgi:hypothetical protein